MEAESSSNSGSASSELSSLLLKLRSDLAQSWLSPSSVSRQLLTNTSAATTPLGDVATPGTEAAAHASSVRSSGSSWAHALRELGVSVSEDERGDTSPER